MLESEFQVGKIIRVLRNEKGYSQKELAEMINVAQNTVSNWENGTREPDNATLIKLAKLFNCSTDYLLGRTDIKNPYEPEAMAVHHDEEEFTEEELEDIKKFKEFVKMRREQKKDDGNDR